MRRGSGGALLCMQAMRYEGQTNAAKEREGRGVLRYAGGAVYEGEWKGGRQEGRGTYTHANGCVYVGEWKVAPHAHIRQAGRHQVSLVHPAAHSARAREGEPQGGLGQVHDRERRRIRGRVGREPAPRARHAQDEHGARRAVQALGRPNVRRRMASGAALRARAVEVYFLIWVLWRRREHLPNMAGAGWRSTPTAPRSMARIA